MPERTYGDGTPYIPAKDPMTAIPPSRHPFQLWTLLACVIGGAGNLVDSKSAINALLPHYIVLVWAVSLLFSGLLAIVGAFVKDRIFGLLLERTGLSTLGVAATCYGLGIMFVAGQAAVVSGPLTISVGIASFWRVAHVNRELRILSKFMKNTAIRDRLGNDSKEA